MWSPFAEKIEVPPKEWFNQGVPSFTQDVPRLETRPFWRIFVPDEMMSMHFMNNLLGEDAVYRKVAFTMDRFSMWRKDVGKASQVIPLETKFMTMPFAHIRGQLWRVSTPRLFVLDSMKGNGVEFIRRRVQLAIPYHYVEVDKEGVPQTRRFMDTSLSAWMYVGNDDVWKSRLLKGSKIRVTNGWEKTVGRVVDGKMFLPVKTYIPKNPLLAENYYFYARTEYLNE